MSHTDRCTWSDLPTDQCAHCDPAARPGVPLLAYPVAHPVVHQAPKTGRLRIVTARAPLHAGEAQDLTDYVAELTDPSSHYEPRQEIHHAKDGSLTTITTRHRVTVPSLIEQLESAVAQSAGVDATSRAGFSSKPSARLDAIDVLALIHAGTHQWTRRTGVSIPWRITAEGTAVLDVPTALRRAAASVLAGSDRKAMTRDVRRWWIAARVVSGWDAPAITLNNTCPVCGQRGGLRVKVQEGLSHAVCTECLGIPDAEQIGIWDEATIGLLALHIKGENDTADQRRAALPPLSASDAGANGAPHPSQMVDPETLIP